MFKDWAILPEFVMNDALNVLKCDSDKPHVVGLRVASLKDARELATSLEKLNAEYVTKALAMEALDDACKQQPIEEVLLGSAMLGIKLQAKLDAAMHFLKAACGDNAALWQQVKEAVDARG